MLLVGTAGRDLHGAGLCLVLVFGKGRSRVRAAIALNNGGAFSWLVETGGRAVLRHTGLHVTTTTTTTITTTTTTTTTSNGCPCKEGATYRQ